MNQEQQSEKLKRKEALKASGRSFSDLLTQNQTQIERGVVNQHAFENVGSSSQVYSSESTGFQAVSERPFQHQAPLPQQRLAARSGNPASIGIDRFLLFGLARPLSSASLGFRHVGPYTRRANGKSGIDHR